MNSSFSSLNNDDQSTNETSDDMLSFIKNYSLEKIRPTLKEQLLMDEDELNQIHLNLMKNRIFINSSANLQSSYTSKNHNESTMDRSIKHFLSENDDNQVVLERFIKLILIGDKQVGKTTLRNKILEDSSCSTPTYSMEIKKRVLELERNIIRLEILDTSFYTQNSVIMKSKRPY